MEKRFQVSLKVFLKNKAGEVLILKLADSSSTPGFYEFPGGRIDENECDAPFSSIIKRELAEELGSIKYKLSPRPTAISHHHYPLGNDSTEKLIWVFFEADYLGGEIKISNESAGYKWVDLATTPLEKYFKKGSLEGVKNYLGIK